MSNSRDCGPGHFDEWQRWCGDQSKKCKVTGSPKHHMLMRLVLSEIPGAATLFPASLGNYERQALHSFIENDSDLQALRHKSYGERGARFVFVGNGTDGTPEARDVLAFSMALEVKELKRAHEEALSAAKEAFEREE